MQQPNLTPPAGRLVWPPVFRKIALYVVGAVLVCGVAATIGMWPGVIVLVVSFFLGFKLLGEYEARRRCQHCGHVPKLSQADYPTCENCLNPKWG